MTQSQIEPDGTTSMSPQQIGALEMNAEAIRLVAVQGISRIHEGWLLNYGSVEEQTLVYLVTPDGGPLEWMMAWAAEEQELPSWRLPHPVNHPDLYREIERSAIYHVVAAALAEVDNERS